MTQLCRATRRGYCAIDFVRDALPGRLDMDESFTRKKFERALASANSDDLAVMHVASHFNLAIGSDDLT